MRTSGVLLHISSLNSNYGIGTFGDAAYEFVDFLDESKQKYWQILPLGPTSYGDSPYQTFSAFANNPYFIDLDILVDEGLLLEDEIIDKTNEESVNYGRLYNTRFKILKNAFKRFDLNDIKFEEFLGKNKHWIYDYATFRALKDQYDGKSWMYWPDELRLREESALGKIREELKEEINFYLFLQFKAFMQWYNLKKYANNKGIEIIGDMPIYVSYDSSDVWARPNLFQLDENLIPTHVAGVPPDGFSKDGQLWGNPLYNWGEHQKESYHWWVLRMRSQMKVFDVVRIDHFVGFINYYSVKYGSETAEIGKWQLAPGFELFRTIEKEVSGLNIIAEDLGNVTENVQKLLDEMKYPGMKLMHFAFNVNDKNGNAPHTFPKNSITYTGTHDNQTTKEWFSDQSDENYNYILDYINCYNKENEVSSIIKEAFKSKSKLVIVPMQDYLELGSQARMNIPATLGGNWVWRLTNNYINNNLSEKIANWTLNYGRAKK